MYYIILTSSFIGTNFLLTFENYKNENKQPPPSKKNKTKQRQKHKQKALGTWDYGTMHTHQVRSVNM